MCEVMSEISNKNLSPQNMLRSLDRNDYLRQQKLTRKLGQTTKDLSSRMITDSIS